jgi:hypothetical protein
VLTDYIQELDEEEQVLLLQSIAQAWPGTMGLKIRLALAELTP